MTEPELLIQLEKITLRLWGKDLLPNTSWSIRRGEHWIVSGPNGGGKSTLMRALFGEVPLPHGTIHRFHKKTPYETFAYVSFERIQEQLKREMLLDEAREHAGKTLGTSMDELLPARKDIPPSFHFLFDHFPKKPVLDELSSGEIRKLAILRAVSRKPEILILDEPFDGLDAKSSKELRKALEPEGLGALTLILVTHRKEDIPSGNFRHLRVERGRVRILEEGLSIPQNSTRKILFPDPPSFSIQSPVGTELLLMENTGIHYNDTYIFEGLNWRVVKGEHWQLSGPNGSGKSSLLGLIRGDHLQSYSNAIRIFGKERGSGESIFDLRRRIGFVRPHVQHSGHARMTLREVAASGHLSIGERIAKGDRDRAEAWLEILGLGDAGDQIFSSLSHGRQRMGLIARALCLWPDLLLMDEPCQGLDPENRDLLLEILERIIKEKGPTLIYVNHTPDPLPSGLNRELHFFPAKEKRRPEVRKIQGLS
ncbi:ATP-binding cassette domain-containing protein [Desulfococcaceae bacterium OttesenSCG-928-F15]|nr:ATP-binding cassette domain-containing protein [Desulfococcaceae bacterium OttesenSCG-928-F15]